MTTQFVSLLITMIIFQGSMSMDPGFYKIERTISGNIVTFIYEHPVDDSNIIDVNYDIEKLVDPNDPQLEIPKPFEIEIDFKGNILVPNPEDIGGFKEFEDLRGFTKVDIILSNPTIPEVLKDAGLPDTITIKTGSVVNVMIDKFCVPDDKTGQDDNYLKSVNNSYFSLVFNNITYKFKISEPQVKSVLNTKQTAGGEEQSTPIMENTDLSDNKGQKVVQTDVREIRPNPNGSEQEISLSVTHSNSSMSRSDLTSHGSSSTTVKNSVITVIPKPDRSDNSESTLVPGGEGDSDMNDRKLSKNFGHSSNGTLKDIDADTEKPRLKEIKEII
jgi:hypothetical protein